MSLNRQRRRNGAHVEEGGAYRVARRAPPDGRELRSIRHPLEPLVAGRLSEEVQADGREFFRVACAHGLEGIIAKHVEKPYRSGRGEWWQKITCKRRDSFVVVGFEPSTVPGHLGRLLLAARQGGDLAYVGGCGTGWSHDLSRELRNLLESIATKSPAVNLRRKNAVFTEPVLVAEVEYRAWTDDGKLRHAAFKGIRPREDDATVFEIPVADQPRTPNLRFPIHETFRVFRCSYRTALETALLDL